MAQDVLIQTIMIHAVQTRNHADSFKDPVTMMILIALMASNVETTTVWDPPMLTLSLALILIAAIQVCQSTKKDANANSKMKFLFLLLLETISLSCKDTDSGTSECKEADSTCLVKRVGNINFFE